MPAVENKPSALPWLEGAKALATTNAPAWLRALRETGASAFAQSGMPDLSWEAWKYTNLRALTKAPFIWSPEAAKFDAKKLPEKLMEGTARAVLVNGQFQPHLSELPDGLTVMPLMTAIERNVDGIEQHLAKLGDLATTPMRALNIAHLRDGFFLIAGKNTSIQTPVEILFYNTASGNAQNAIYPHLVYWLCENAEINLIERHCGDGAYFTSIDTEIVLEQQARLKFYRFEKESDIALHFSFTSLQQHKDSSFEGFSYAQGALLGRQDFLNNLLGEGISSNLGGIYTLRNHQTCDFTVLMDHFEPNGTSVQRFKGVVDDQARAVFQGKIHVRRSAQKTDGYQLNHALLLSPQAEASFKPELEIYADDVKCTHGATSGQIDSKALFYLTSRGIPETEARALLVQSFLAETLAQVSFAPVAALYEEMIAAWLLK